MDEYIEKQAAIENALAAVPRDEYFDRQIEVFINLIPPADVRPVVFCRDCFANGLCSVQEVLFDNDLDKAENFYCANGRKEEDG